MEQRLFKKVKVIVLDVDGVFTNGKKTFNLNGDVVYKEFLDRDFTALNVLLKYFKVVILSGDDRVNREVFKNKKIPFYHSRGKSKKRLLRAILNRYNIGPDECIFIGDDFPDLKCIQMIPLSFCPKDAVSDVKASVHAVFKVKGGEGVIVYLLDVLSYEIMLRRKYGEE